MSDISIPKECEDLIREYENIINLLDGFYENNVSFNINSLISTLNNINIVDMSEGIRTGIYHNVFYNNNDNDNVEVEMVIAFAISNTETYLSYEIARIEFNAVYVDKEHSSDVRILKLNKGGLFKSIE